MHGAMKLFLLCLLVLPLSCERSGKQSAQNPQIQELVKDSVGEEKPRGVASNRQTKEKCTKTALFTIGSTMVWRLDDSSLLFVSGLAVDADGSPRAYHPDNIGLDHLANAGQPGNWWGLATDNGKPDGTPVIQKENDPYPGYYISITSLQDHTKKITDPNRYVDSEKTPYVVLPPKVMKAGSARLGDFAVTYNLRNSKLSYAIFADVGPNSKIGEGSMALARELDINSDPKKGGADKDIAYLVFSGSGNGKPRYMEEINRITERLFNNWGGIERLKACLQ